MHILNVNKTTVKLSDSEMMALYLIARDYGETPQSLLSRIVRSHFNKTIASSVREFLITHLIHLIRKGI